VFYKICGQNYIPEYSKTSDSGSSEIETFQQRMFSRSQIIVFPVVPIHFEPLRRGQALYKLKDTTLEFIFFPKHPAFGGFAL